MWILALWLLTGGGGGGGGGEDLSSLYIDKLLCACFRKFKGKGPLQVFGREQDLRFCQWGEMW